MPADPAQSWWKPEVSRRIAAGSQESARELEAALRPMAKPGQKVPGKSSIAKYVTELRAGAPPPPAPLPPEALKPGDRTPMQSEEVVGMLTGFLRQQEALVEGYTRREDLANAQRTLRQVTALAALIEKMRRKDDEDGEVVKVKASDMAAAAERARSKLHDLVSRLSAEKAA